MLYREEWSLVQQEVVAGVHELSKSYNFNESEFSNISIALQFFTRKEKQTAALKKQAQIEDAREDFGFGDGEYYDEDPFAYDEFGGGRFDEFGYDEFGGGGFDEFGGGGFDEFGEFDDFGFRRRNLKKRKLISKKEQKLQEYKAASNATASKKNLTEHDIRFQNYENAVKFIFPYIELVGMFELKSDSVYETWNDINENIYEWKKYDDTSLETNSHGLLEMKFNLKDATLKGTGNHIDKMTEVVSRYQLRLNQSNLIRDSFLNCTKEPACSEVLNVARHQVADRISNSKYLALTEKNRNETETYISEMNEKLLLQDDAIFYPYYEHYYTNVVVEEIN